MAVVFDALDAAVVGESGDGVGGSAGGFVGGVADLVREGWGAKVAIGDISDCS